MSTELTIFEIRPDMKFKEHGHRITFIQVGNAIYSNEIREILESISTQNYWHLESECGFTGELLGKDILFAMNKANLKKDEPKNAQLLKDNLKENEYYRIMVSF